MKTAAVFVFIIAAVISAPVPDEIELIPFAIADSDCFHNCDCQQGEIKNVFGDCVLDTKNSKYLIEYDYYHYEDQDKEDKRKEENYEDYEDQFVGKLCDSDSDCALPSWSSTKDLPSYCHNNSARCQDDARPKSCQYSPQKCTY